MATARAVRPRSATTAIDARIRFRFFITLSLSVAAGLCAFDRSEGSRMRSVTACADERRWSRISRILRQAFLTCRREAVHSFVYSRPMTSVAAPTAPVRGLARLFGWRRVRVTLIASGSLGLLISLPNETATIIVL